MDVSNVIIITVVGSVYLDDDDDDDSCVLGTVGCPSGKLFFNTPGDEVHPSTRARIIPLLARRRVDELSPSNNTRGR